MQIHQHRKVSAAEAAQYLGISSSTLSKLRVFGGGPKFHKLGRRVVETRARCAGCCALARETEAGPGHDQRTRIAPHVGRPRHSRRDAHSRGDSGIGGGGPAAAGAVAIRWVRATAAGLGGQSCDPGIAGMSWRDRLARREAAEQPVADCARSAKSPPSRSIGTNGAIGNDERTNAATLPRGWQTLAKPTPSGSRPMVETGVGIGWGDAEDERAAIVEHEGGAPHEWAEGFARLDPDWPHAE